MKSTLKIKLNIFALSLGLVSNPAIAQVYGLCGFGAGNMTGEIEMVEMDIEGGIALDGTIDCAALCGGGGTATGEFDGTLT